VEIILQAVKKIGLLKDPTQDSIIKGVNYIYALYAEGRISKEEALNRLSTFLDSKGETESNLLALSAIKTWRR